MSADQQLVTLQQREFSIAKLYLRAGECVQLVAVAVAVVAVMRDQARDTYVAAAAFAGPLILFLLREIGARYQSAGERVRRMLLVWEGLGEKPSAEELADAHVRGATLRSFDPPSQVAYYSSNLPPGKRRLAEHVQESAFYTKEEAHTAMIVYGALTLAGLIATIGLVWFWLREPSAMPQSSTQPQGAQLAATLIVFFGTGHVVQSTLSFFRLREAADRTFQKAGKLKRASEADLRELELNHLMSSYDTAVAKAPPLPGWAYRLRGKKLDKTWRAQMLAPPE